MRRSLWTSRAAALLVLLWGNAGMADCEMHARELLLGELQQRYPAVMRWNVETIEHGGARAVRCNGADAAIRQLVVTKTGSRSAVQVEFSKEGVKRYKQTFWYAVSGYGAALAAQRSLAAGAALSDEDVSLVEMDVIAAGCEPFMLGRAGIAGERLRTNRALRKGAMLCAASVEPRPAVARGETVAVRYIGNRIQLRARAIAQSDGEVGMQVFLKSTGNKEQLMAVVSANGEVTIRD